MKKKTLPILMLIAGLSTAALAACGHNHKWDWKNSDDGTTHWQECACGEKREDSEGLHVDVKNNDTNTAEADGKCDECGAHVHNYVWKSDALNHWQECSHDSSHKTSAEGHVDVKNNATNAYGSDGKCDDCDRVATVRFNMLGHGVAPANLYIDLGEKVNEPSIDDDDCWKFKGWYKDDACTEPFDFDAPIDAVTPIYAKWEEDKTPGASRKHAFELDGEDQRLEAAKPGEVVFFKFKATKEGRYTVALGDGVNSENSTFKTTLTGDAVYGKDCDLNKITFDMNEDETVYVMFTYLGEGGEDATAGVILTETTDEPLPEDYFLDGDYFNGDYAFSFDRAKKELTIENGGGALNVGQTYNVKYIAGRFDSIYFDVNTEIGESGETTTTTHYIKYNKNSGTYSYTNDAADGASRLAFAEPQTPVALEKVFGYYEPSGAATSGITELYIYESGSEDSTTVLYKQNGSYHDLSYAIYNTEKNRLTFDGYTVTLNLSDDNEVVSINVLGINDSVMYSNTYTLKGEAGVTQDLPLNIGTEFYGETYSIKSYWYGNYFGADENKITVLNYVESTDTYTVVVSAGSSFVKYKLKVSIDAEYNVVSIALYDEDGTLLDTLTPFEYIYHELPTTSTNISLAASDFQKGQIYLFKVTEGGWYQFTNVPDGVQIYYNLDPNNPSVLDYAKLVGSDVVSLAGPIVWNPEDPDNGTTYALVGVFVTEPTAVSFTVAPGSAPAGWKSNDPKILENGSATLENADNTQDFYFRFVAPEAGSYLIRVYYGEGNYYTLSYTINGNTYGQDENYQWLGGVTEEKPYAVVSTPDGSLNIDIAVRYNSQWNSTIDITVVVMDDYSAGATDVSLTGEPANDSLILSATVTAGVNYHLASDTHETAVTATASAAFTVKTQDGKVLEATKDGDVFTASIPADTDYFAIVSATNGLSVTLSQTFKHGDIGYPITASAEEGNNTLTVGSGTTFFTLPAGMYSIAVSSTYGLSLYIGDSNIPKNFGAVYTIEDGDLLYCNNYSGEAVTLTITEAIPVFTADQAGTYEGTVAGTYGSADVSLTFDIYGSGTFVIDEFPYPIATYDVSIKKVTDSNAYTFTYTYLDESDWFNPVDVTATVTFTFNEGALQVLSTALNGGNAFTMEEAAPAEATYTGTYNDGSEDVVITLTLSGDKTSAVYYINGENLYEGEIEQGEDGYSFSYGEGWMASIVTFTDNGDGTLTLTDYFGDITLTKA